MGGCLSSVGGDSVTVRSSSSNNSAFVISPKGDLQPYSTPVFVYEVLDQMENSTSFFVCNSDNLSYDQHIRALDAQHELDAGQIYFALPISKLHDRLSASEMAALAGKANLALNSKTSSSKGYSHQQKRSNNSYKKSKKISPFVVMETSKINVIIDEEAADHHRLMLDQKLQQSSMSLGVSRSGSIRKMQRYSSRKAQLAVRSFRLRLSTIYKTESSSDQSHSHKLY